LITGLRNLLYDKSILNSYSPSIPVITIGNIIAGGTGKTPMVAWIAKELSSKYRVGILSRGFGRRTNGFQLLDNLSSPETVGDEPMELRLLLPGIPIAVDRNRKRGIQLLASGTFGNIDLIIMDDGFQHRRVKPGYAIILDDFNRPMHLEKLLPAGLRREPLSGLKRADQIIVTKKENPVPDLQPDSRILLITGIANPNPLVKEIAKTGVQYRHLKFRDHYRYTPADARLIQKTYQESLASENQSPVTILTTGKDYVKLSRFQELADLPLHWIPIGPPIQADQKQEILNKIDKYVERTIGNR
jgi:tetraacyldisaccharide 4'-kinase